MKLEQYKAIVDYCKENGYGSKNELLKELHSRGVIPKNSPIEVLATKVKDETYKTMYDYLTKT